MANSIAKFKKYVPLLDEVYKNSALTSILDSDDSLAKAGANANEIIIPKIDMDALGDYDRNSGYTNGDVTMTNETVKFNYERGRMFTVDAMDDEDDLCHAVDESRNIQDLKDFMNMLQLFVGEYLKNPEE